MDKIYVYAGTGAVLAKDVEVALDKLDIDYNEIEETDIKEDKLEKNSVLIVPGGYTKRCIKALVDSGREIIREFISKGGSYIGICAGAYMASKTVEVQGHPPGLDIININNKRESGTGIRTITITEPEHPLASDCDKKIKIWYQNGPMIKPGKDIETVAVYEKGQAAIVYGNFGKGKVIIFSPHPEGSLNNGIDAEELGTLKLLDNTILFASKSSKHE